MKLIRKILSILLSAGIIFNSIYPTVVFAMDVNNTNDLHQNKEISIDDNFTPKGNIEVETNLVLPLRNREQNNIVFSIYDASNNHASIDLNNINTASDGIYEQYLELGNQKIRAVATKRDKDGGLLSGVDYENTIVYLSINLYSLDKGTYTIEFSGKHFVTYKKEVTLDDFSQRVSLTDETGMFEIGDINNDGQVNEQDSNLMLEYIDSNNLEYDLNLDGIIDIADLNYITAILTGTKKQAKVENTDAIISSENVSFEISPGTIAEGSSDLSSIFQDEGIVKLQPADGGQIAEDNPVKLSLDLGNSKSSEAIEMSEIRMAVGKDAPTKMEFQIETSNGKKITKKYPENANNSKSISNIHYFTEEATDNSIVINLEGQIAVKKVTIIITETSTNNLADIAKVEFLNNVKMETKEPEGLYIPKITSIDNTKSEQLTINFEPVENITGYEIKVVGPNMATNGTIFQTTFNTFTVEDLKNYKTYQIYVQSVNGKWESGWSEATEASPQATRKPPAVDMVKATPTYSGIDFSWKNMDDTKSYNIYYREVGTEKWKDIKNINGTSYSLKGLKGAVEYEAYLTGNNDLGEGDKSQVVKATTLKAEATITPNYKIINEFDENLGRTSHIKDVVSTVGTMVDGDKFSMVDDNFKSYWNYPGFYVNSYYPNLGFPTFILDKAYTMDEFVITVPDSYPYNYKSGNFNEKASDANDTVVYYWNTDADRTANNRTTARGVLYSKYDKNNRKYYLLKLQDPIKANALQFGLTVANNSPLAQISEVKFYEYDSLVDDVDKLFKDKELRLELEDNVTQDTINKLRERANIQDHGEYSAYRETVLADLDYAEKILKDEKIDDIITLDPNISNSYNGHLGFAMTINDYQPLGIVARPGDKLTIYVGSAGNINAEVVYTQYFAEANAWQKTYSKKLEKGQNIIEIDKIGDASDERGGSVYIRYTSKPDTTKPIKVRVSGGTKIPMLDTSLLTTDEEKKEAVQNYINTLNTYTSSLAETYTKEGKNYVPEKSVLDSTEIVTKHGLLSVSAVAVKNALNSGTSSLDDKINRLYESTEAFDEMMEMFYRQKGLSKNAEDPKNEMPKARINIRYMRMFDGAFMYAGGYHIGIGYGSIAGLIQAHRNTDSKTGYFGWGISHEIGHQINQSNTVYAEVTNNIYSMLAQTSNDNDNSRLESSGIYEKIYDKVTSHTLGRSQNVFVQLGMYWQLHLAYDDNKTFNDENSIYAEINKISRSYDNRTKKYNRDDLTILFASLAAKKDLTNYFEIWGLKASDAVKAEIATYNYPKEDKAIYYLNDQARRYRLSKNTGITNSTKVNASITESSSKDKRVTLSFNVNAENEKILGYEILRNGESIAFVDSKENTYTDNLGAENNRAYTYSVIAYDYLLNKTEPMILDEIKISHDGSILKDTFLIESNVKQPNEIVDYEDDTMDYSKLSVNKLIDGKNDTYFNGTEKIKTLVQNGNNVDTSTDTGNAYVIINLNGKLSISGIKYKAALSNGTLMENTIKNYKVYVSSNKQDWTEVKNGTFNLTKENDYTDLVYFTKEGTTSKTQLWTYNNVSYIKIESVGNAKGLSGAEIDIIAPPGDNIDISMTDTNTPSIGVLEKDYCYLTAGCDPEDKDEEGNVKGLIKANSVIIKGTYRGSPSFNVLTMGDANDLTKLYSGYQLLFAEVNNDNSVYNVGKGHWIYVMTQEEYETMIQNSSKVRAYLYRVNDAKTNDGQRLTSTSTSISNLPEYSKLNKAIITSSDTSSTKD